MHWIASRARRIGALLLSCTLAACGGITVRPDSALPRPLLQPLPAHAGLVLDEELRRYKHEETRSSADWAVELGGAHEKFMRYLFEASFSDVQAFNSIEAARAASGVQALFQPRIEQYSFATANETSGAYWAVTIRYRIAVLTPQGEPVDSLTLTGYGSARDQGRASQALTAATRAAMRDAAAKFLVQAPRQAVVAKLEGGQVLSAADSTALAVDVVEAVPIEPAG
jgi:hypothetical protein